MHVQANRRKAEGDAAVVDARAVSRPRSAHTPCSTAPRRSCIVHLGITFRLPPVRLHVHPSFAIAFIPDGTSIAKQAPTHRRPHGNEDSPDPSSFALPEVPPSSSARVDGGRGGCGVCRVEGSEAGDEPLVLGGTREEAAAGPAGAGDELARSDRVGPGDRGGRDAGAGRRAAWRRGAVRAGDGASSAARVNRGGSRLTSNGSPSRLRALTRGGAAW